MSVFRLFVEIFQEQLQQGREYKVVNTKISIVIYICIYDIFYTYIYIYIYIYIYTYTYIYYIHTKGKKEVHKKLTAE